MEKENDPTELQRSKSNRGRLTRRRLLKSAVAVAPAGIWPFGFANISVSSRSSSTTDSISSQSPAPAKNPRWYGFNLLEYFSTDPDWMKYFPYEDDGMFVESDFQWIRDWGFNWVRLPMDYRFRTAPDLFTINEERIKTIDRAIRLAIRCRSPTINASGCVARLPVPIGYRPGLLRMTKEECSATVRNSRAIFIPGPAFPPKVFPFTLARWVATNTHRPRLCWPGLATRSRSWVN